MTRAIHVCGGTILSASDHDYCDRCRAFAYDGRPVPDGTDEHENRSAWDAGEVTSPDAEETINRQESAWDRWQSRDHASPAERLELDHRARRETR